MQQQQHPPTHPPCRSWPQEATPITRTYLNVLQLNDEVIVPVWDEETYLEDEALAMWGSVAGGRYAGRVVTVREGRVVTVREGRGVVTQWWVSARRVPGREAGGGSLRSGGYAPGECQAGRPEGGRYAVVGMLQASSRQGGRRGVVTQWWVCTRRVPGREAGGGWGFMLGPCPNFLKQLPGGISKRLPGGNSKQLPSCT